MYALISQGLFGLNQSINIYEIDSFNLVIYS